MDGFSKLVKDCKSKNLNRVISNASEEHAKILFQELLSNADASNPIRIISGCLKENFYIALIADFKKAMARGATVDIIALCDPVENQFISFIQGHEQGSITFSNGNEDDVSHFIIVGSKSYRLEIDDKTKEARANFNDDVIGNILIAIFANTQNNASLAS